jgi:hypothetical protein
MKYLLLIFAAFVFSGVFAQAEERETETVSGDTITTVYSKYENGKPVETKGSHKRVYKFMKEMNGTSVSKGAFISEKFFDLNGNPAEPYGYHKKVKYWKYYKFYDKKGDPVLYVEEPYFYEWSDASIITYEFHKNGDLKSVAYYAYDSNGKLKPTAGAYLNADVHKYVYTFDRKKGTVKEKIYAPWDNLVKITTYSWKGFK